MRIGRLLSPVHSLGPGERVCLWTTGCAKRCEGCISPELQVFAGNDINEKSLGDILKKVAKNSECSGLTISGGDPFEQAEGLLRLLKEVRDYFEDILVYTGYELGEIQKGCEGEAGVECLRYIDVLIDGRYKKELNHPACVLRGSENQVIHYLNPNVKESYTEYMCKGRILESFTHENTRIITGIMNEEG